MTEREYKATLVVLMTWVMERKRPEPELALGLAKEARLQTLRADYWKTMASCDRAQRVVDRARQNEYETESSEEAFALDEAKHAVGEAAKALDAFGGEP